MYWGRISWILVVIVLCIGELNAWSPSSKEADENNEVDKPSPDIGPRVKGTLLKFGLGAWPGLLVFASAWSSGGIVETTLASLELEYVFFDEQRIRLSQVIAGTYNFSCEERIDVNGGRNNDNPIEQAEDEIYTCHHGPHIIAHTRIYVIGEPSSFAFYAGPSFGFYSYQFIGAQPPNTNTLSIEKKETGKRFSFGANTGFLWQTRNLTRGFLDFGIFYMYTAPQAFRYTVKRKGKVLHQGRYNAGLNLIGVMAAYVLPVSF